MWLSHSQHRAQYCPAVVVVFPAACMKLLPIQSLTLLISCWIPGAPIHDFEDICKCEHLPHFSYKVHKKPFKELKWKTKGTRWYLGPSNLYWWHSRCPRLEHFWMKQVCLCPNVWLLMERNTNTESNPSLRASSLSYFSAVRCSQSENPQLGLGTINKLLAIRASVWLASPKHSSPQYLGDYTASIALHSTTLHTQLH